MAPFLGGFVAAVLGVFGDPSVVGAGGECPVAVAHLGGYPLGGFAGHEHHAGVGVAHLFGWAVADAGAFEQGGPGAAQGDVAGPAGLGVAVVEDGGALQPGVGFLGLEGGEGVGKQVDGALTCLGFGAF